MSYFGDIRIGRMPLGEVEIAKAYLGTDLVFKKGGVTPTVVFYDRLVFDGTARIQTDYLFPANGSIAVQIGDEKTKAAQRVFRVDDGTNIIGLVYAGNTSSTYRYFLPYYDSTNYLLSGNAQRLSFSYSRFDFFMTPNGDGWGNYYQSYTKGATHPNAGLCFGGGGTATQFTGTMGIFRVYGSEAASVNKYSGFDNYTPVATFRPCTYNGEAGMWHVEGNKFYGNTAGSGTLSVIND